MVRLPLSVLGDLSRSPALATFGFFSFGGSTLSATLRAINSSLTADFNAPYKTR